ncbi:hypothetical protein QA612_07900 [Evansella sp. AB-P1]|uniref:hypothetical protein n=1 Tax=Evansella sp. AB-P1 TaxID=3037653 RepID=UPI00241DCA12|nr:hypothetical protein [Evansella sp. AB-P1]MDG5787415.1 hypothetical protein [Evansella sp. AB-P1]
MVNRTMPITDKYFRYVVTWVLFGGLGTFLFWQWNWVYASICLVVAFLVTFGVDILFLFIVKQKVKAIVNEKPKLIVDAVRIRMEKRGYLVITNGFVLFVPIFRKIKTVIEADQIVRFEVERVLVEITARFPNQYRTFSYNVLSTKKVSQALQDLTGETFPYKYEKLENKSLS